MSHRGLFALALLAQMGLTATHGAAQCPAIRVAVSARMDSAAGRDAIARAFDTFPSVARARPAAGAADVDLLIEQFDRNTSSPNARIRWCVTARARWWDNAETELLADAVCAQGSVAVITPSAPSDTQLQREIVAPVMAALAVANGSRWDLRLGNGARAAHAVTAGDSQDLRGRIRRVGGEDRIECLADDTIVTATIQGCPVKGSRRQPLVEARRARKASVTFWQDHERVDALILSKDRAQEVELRFEPEGNGTPITFPCGGEPRFALDESSACTGGSVGAKTGVVRWSLIAKDDEGLVAFRAMDADGGPAEPSTIRVAFTRPVLAKVESFVSRILVFVGAAGTALSAWAWWRKSSTKKKKKKKREEPEPPPTKKEEGPRPESSKSPDPDDASDGGAG
jgi:hypothetical protein